MNSKKITMIVLQIFLLFSLVGYAYAGENPPTVPRPDDIPQHILEPWTLVDDLFPAGTLEALSAEEEITPITPKIVGGSPVSPENAYPWMARLVYVGQDYCGGSLIEPNWVLTAAHCWTNETGIPYDVTENDVVILGDYDTTDVSGNEQEIQIESVYIHPDYDVSTLQYDVALLELKTPATLDDYVDIVNVAMDSPRFVTGIYNWSVVTMGWGTTSYEGSYSDVLQDASITYLADNKCAAYGVFYDAASMECAGLSAGGRDSCQGDSGGPLVVQIGEEWIQIGVTSWGYECALPDYPGVYARLSTATVFEWITSTLNLTLSPVTGIQPSGLTRNVAPMTTWNPVPEKPLFFRVIVLNPDGTKHHAFNVFRTWFCDNSTTDLCRWRISPDMPEGDGYTYQIRPYKVGYGWGDWSYVTLNVHPYLNMLSPADGTTITDANPTFAWSDSSSWGAEEFEFYLVHTDGTDTPYSFNLQVDTYCSGGVCSFQPDLGLTSGTYSWQIRAYKATIGWTSYTTPWTGSISVVP